jgi:hypothetical protein
MVVNLGQLSVTSTVLLKAAMSDKLKVENLGLLLAGQTEA